MTQPHDHIGPPDKSGSPKVAFGVADGTTLTAAYVTGTPVNVKRYSGVTAAIRYQKGDETTARCRVMIGKGQQSTDATWFQAGELGTATSGLRALNLGEVKLTPADFASDSYVTFDVACRGADWVRLDFYAVGGTPTGKVYAEIWGAWGL